MSEVFRKDPDVDKTFGLNWEPRLGTRTITDSAWTAPAGITILDDDFTDTSTTVQLSGGTDGEDYELTNTVTLDNDDAEDWDVVIQVRQASWKLTEDELLILAEIAIEDLSDVETIAEDLTVNQATYLRDEMATWATIRNSHVRLKGGTDGVDFDNARKREAIRERVRKALGLPLYSPEVMGGSWSVAVKGVF